MTRSRTLEKARILAFLLSMVALLMTATLASAELTAWDQEQVTAIAAELAEKTKDLRNTLRRQPPPTLGQPGKRAFHQLRDDLASIQATARRLHNALAEGATRDETFPTYQRLMSSVRSASDELRRTNLGEPVTGRVEAAAEALGRLRPYYEEDPPA
jgi:uncharacterized membrane protein YccC